MNKLVFLFLILVLAIAFPLFFKLKETFKKRDGFSNYNLDTAGGVFPDSETNVLLQDMYPPTGSLGISDYTSNDTWWHKPVFKVGSYAQITNNIRYSNNPDLGSCMPISMCGALYHDKQIKTNYIKPLPPLDPNCGTRVGYFDTDVNLLPFRTDMQNILY